jgi:uncharacterized Zn finger protein
MNSQTPPRCKELTLQCPEKKCRRVFEVNNEVFQNNGYRAKCPHCGKIRQHRTADVIAHNYKPAD